MQDKVDALKQAERTMMDAIHAAIIQAAKESEAAFQPLGPPTTAQAYFVDAAMRQLFLHLCGANADTAKGGDPDHAWEILYLGAARPAIGKKNAEFGRDAERQRAMRSSK